MSDPFRDQVFPRSVLLGAAALIGFSLIAVGATRMGAFDAPSVAGLAPVESVEIRFADQDDGAVLVHDARDGRVIATLAPGSDNFIRGVLRGLARKRKLEGVGNDAAFQLVRWTDGHLSLSDTATEQEIDLNAFGPTNSEAFARLLVAGRASS